MTLPPGHYGKAGRDLETPRPAAPPVEDLAWRWFLPRRTARRKVAAVGTALLAFLLAPGGYAAALWVGGFGVFLVLVLGVALRRVVPVGRMWRRDPAGAAYIADQRSHMYAVIGLVMIGGALAAMLIAAAADLVVS